MQGQVNGLKRNIPNILSLLRLAAIPFFIIVYNKGEEYALGAAAIFTAASFTDVLDGYLARRNNWVTPVGKILDPLADKLMQFTVLICLVRTNAYFTWLLVLFVLKELTMVAGACIVLRTKHDIVVSNWYGKMATVVFFLVTNVFIIFRHNQVLNIVLGILLGVTLVFALGMYYFKVFRGRYGLKNMDHMRKGKK